MSGAPQPAAVNAGMPFRLFRTARIGRRPDGALSMAVDGAPVSGREAAAWTGDLTVVVNDPQYIHHYFHFIEIVLALWAFHRESLPGLAVRRIVFSSVTWDNPHQNHVQREILAAVYPEAAVADPATLEEGEAGPVLLVDRHLAATRINKFLEPVLPIAGRWSAAFVEAVLRHVGAASKAPPRDGAVRLLYVPRRPPRRLVPGVEEALLERMRRHGITVEVVDFAGLSWHDQVRVTSRCDAMAGVHGNGLTNLLWLPPHAGVLELFVAGAHHYDYQMLAELKHALYFGVEGRDGGYVYREHSRFGAAVGAGATNNCEVAELPWDAVDRFLDAFLHALRRHREAG